MLVCTKKREGGNIYEMMDTSGPAIRAIKGSEAAFLMENDQEILGLKLDRNGRPYVDRMVMRYDWYLQEHFLTWDVLPDESAVLFHCASKTPGRLRAILVSDRCAMGSFEYDLEMDGMSLMEIAYAGRLECRYGTAMYAVLWYRDDKTGKAARLHCLFLGGRLIASSRDPMARTPFETDGDRILFGYMTLYPENMKRR